MAHLAVHSAYRDLAHRLNRFPQGAPSSGLLFAILKHLFTEDEARLVALLPLKVFDAEKAARAWKMDMAATQKVLDRLCDKALVVDIRQKDRTVYCLPPPMAGFFEFAFMRVRSDIDQKALAELLYQYINVDADFAQALFATGDTSLGRVFVQEPQVRPSLMLSVLDFERAGQVIRDAGVISVGQCYCRHKMSHVGRACDNPQDICLTLNMTAAALIRHGQARRIETAEALALLETAYDHQLVQFGENVRHEINFICNCCKCCCEAMIAARQFAVFHPVQTSNFIAHLDQAGCSGCGRCASVCPVDALTLQAPAANAKTRAATVRLNSEVCLGCGVCARQCPTGALVMKARARRVVTPMNTAHRVVLMAIERNTLQHIVCDNQVLHSHRALATLLGVIFKLPPVKRMLAAKQLQSRYLEKLVQRLGWQPACDYSLND